MNTEKVLIGFNKKGEEILVFRKDNNTYIDLNSDNNEVILKEDIDLTTLTFANKSLKLRKHMLESLIKRKYKKDREKLLETKDILFGAEFVIKDLKETKTDSGWRLCGVPQYNYNYSWQNEVTENMSLFLFSREVKINDYTYNVYINLSNKKEYIIFKDNVKHISSLPSFREGMKYIFSTDFTLEDALGEKVLEKKKIYEYAYETRNTKLKK